MKNAALWAFFALLLLFVLACERESKEFGGVRGSLAAQPEHSVGVDVSAIPALSHIASVSPRFGNEDADAVLDGAALYQANCSACHQVTGLGIPGAFPPLDGSAYVTGPRVDRMAAIMIYGLLGPITVKGVPYNSAMAGLGATLNDKELAAIATYVRSNWSNKAGEVKEEVFAEARKKWGSRGPFNIKELGEEAP